MVLTLSANETLLLGALGYLVYLLIKYHNRGIGTIKRKDQIYRDLPGWPLIGQLPEILSDTYPLETGAMKVFQNGLGYCETMPGMRFIDISKPEWIEYVQKTNFNNYVKGPLFWNIMADAFGQGIFVTDGPIWKKTRHATSTLFNVNAFKLVMVPTANQSLSRLITVLKSASEEKRSIDFCNLFFRFTLESFVRMTFGTDLGLINEEYKTKVESESPKKISQASMLFAEAFDYVQEQLDFRFNFLKGWQLVETLNVSLGRKMKAACQVLDDFAYNLIDERMRSQDIEESKDDGLFHKDLLGMLMTASDERGIHLGRTELRDAVLNLIVAGRDTTAEALSWGFFHLLMNPDIVSKIREETHNILGDDPEDQQVVDYDNYKRFTCTLAAVYETLRLHPSVPKSAKFAVEADRIPNGPAIGPGDCVRWSDWQMARDPAIWGPDCGEFKPERWIDEKGGIRQVGQFKFHTFNGGPRLCLGMNLALFQLVKVIVEVFRDFDLRFADGWYENVPKGKKIDGVSSKYEVPMYRSSLTLLMQNPMMIIVSPRQT